MIHNNKVYADFNSTIKYLAFGLLFLWGCQNGESPAPQTENKLFTSVSAEDSGLDFVNHLEETLESNYYQYLYTYIGGGVAAGDINNDGLIDIFFTSNSSPNKLYLNKGNLQFEDITTKAGISHLEGFDTGVTMVDVNADGYLDIYVSRGGWKDEDNKFANLLYINNHDLTFTEKAKALGLDDANRTIQSTFFDYDNDNDLDVYISNSPNVTGRSKTVNLSQSQKDAANLNSKGCDRLYENDGKGFFTDVSEKAGLAYDLGFGLNPQVADLNNDGWLDLYVCNDFNYPDLVYLNNKNKTFTESRDEVFQHMSFNSMGSDVADINNDGWMDVMTLDMNPEDYIRSKTTMSMTSIQRFEAMVKNGYHHQYMHNMLQVNNENGTYREIANMAGMANTDWSWALLSADFDLDGWNDMYITNGVYRDVLDQDKNIEIRNILRKNNRRPTKADLLKFTQMLPQQKVRNYFFRNQTDFTFQDVTEDWANEIPTFSNGAIYADLDNDGDLDIVVNNINDQATLLKNNAVENDLGNFLKIKLNGSVNNPRGIGTKLELAFEDGSQQTRLHIPTRGYLSSVSNIIHFGFQNQVPQKLSITWNDGNFQEININGINQELEISYANNNLKKETPSPSPLFTNPKVIHQHSDPYFNDYSLQVLLPNKLSQTGPFATQADVNGDGLTDLYIGGGYRQAGQLCLARNDGSFEKLTTEAFVKDARYEDQGALFFDADNDGDQDLYVVSGSYEFYQTPRALQDRLYLNDGSGKFEKAISALPTINASGSVVTGADVDSDGDVDLFVGGRVIPGKYPYASKSYILINEKGKFTDATELVAPDLSNVGLVTDAIWTDINQDGQTDLILTGEWLGIEVFLNKNGKLEKSTAHPELSERRGWWNQLKVVDIDQDGDQDIIAGNLGLNSKFHASPKKPFRIYTDDFDSNGIEDIILAKEYKGKEVPIRGKTCMTQQIPSLAQKVKTYNDFAQSELSEIVGAQLSSCLNYEATEFRSGIFLNQNNTFTFVPFASPAQMSPINSMVYADMDGDGIEDILLAGNNHQAEVETTRYDAGISTFLKGTGGGAFEVAPNSATGLYLDGDVRDMQLVKNRQSSILIVINNNEEHETYRLNVSQAQDQVN
ncbi:MAG: VCBS repeat-containing protein [Bacteroidota bacterium]